ncbi:hypothetical protein GJAV_G00104420 [Gymnothorax javanicus]|nr:hypothetical protein GJAV_G00104420 [Gymnothorax javanicus]
MISCNNVLGNVRLTPLWISQPQQGRKRRQLVRSASKHWRRSDRRRWPGPRDRARHMRPARVTL